MVRSAQVLKIADHIARGMAPRCRTIAQADSHSRIGPVIIKPVGTIPAIQRICPLPPAKPVFPAPAGQGIRPIQPAQTVVAIIAGEHIGIV